MILLMMKKKHKCTNSLLIDFLKLLTLLKVPNVPSSWHKLKQAVNKVQKQPKDKQKLIDLTLYFCPECGNESTSSEKCTNKDCPCNKIALISPHTFMIMNIEHQIQQVLSTINHNELHISRSMCTDVTSLSMTDIQDGRVYMNISRTLNNQSDSKFITLTCNIDGVKVYTNSEQSMWTFTACINELQRKIRFSIENIIGKKFARLKTDRRIIRLKLILFQDNQQKTFDRLILLFSIIIH